MARASNVTVIQSLQNELDGHLEKVKQFSEQDKQLTQTISTLQ